VEQRKKLIVQFNKYKNCLAYSGSAKDDNEIIFHNDANQFFQGYSELVEEIVKRVGERPKVLAKIIASRRSQKLDVEVFAQNIIYHLYPCYLPNESVGSNCLLFIEEMMKEWNYDVIHYRPKEYTAIDDMINGLNRTPEIASYTEKISRVFMSEMGKCEMNAWVFNEEE
jgi:hypothetical protein